MRILFVSHGFPPHAQGGAEIYAHAHATACARAGDEVLVLTRESNSAREEYSVRDERRDGLTIAWVNNTFAATTSFADTYRNAGVRRAAAPIIEAFAPEVVHVHHLTCLSTDIVSDLAASRVPVFFTLHDYWLICHRGQLLDLQLNVCSGPEPYGCGACLGAAAGVGGGVYAARSVLTRMESALPAAVTRPLRAAGALVTGATASRGRERTESADRMAHMRDVASGVTHFFAPSRFMRDRFIAFGIDPSRISWSEYGCALTPVPRLPRAAGSLRLGFLGSLMVSKAPHLLLEAAAGLPPGSVSVDLFGEPVDYHGDSTYRARLAPLLMQPNVQVHGKVAHHDVGRIFSSIDVLVVPSIWPENSPLVIREAFLAGVPVVASRIGGIPETVTDGVNGLLFAPGDAADLRRALQQLTSDPALLEQLQRGIPPVRTLDDDVAAMRKAYAAATSARSLPRRLAAVVLNYRTPDDTFLAVRSLLMSSRPPDEVIVVDNGSTSDDCRTMLARFGPRVIFIASGLNRGFSGGMNLGIREALARGAERVLLVNSDAILPHDALNALEAELDRHPKAGIAGPVVLARHAPDRIGTMGMDYSRATGRMRHRSVGDRFAGNSSGADEVDGVSGCVMLVRREVFTAVGLLDEDYFFGFEDLDFCLRAGSAGFSTILARNATVLHEGGKSIGVESPRRLYFGARNQLLMAQRTDRSRGRLASAARAGYIVALNLAHAVTARGATLPRRIAAVGRGSLDYWRARLGPGADQS